MRHTVDIDKLTTMFDDVLPGKCTDSLTSTVSETAQLRNILTNQDCLLYSNV